LERLADEFVRSGYDIAHIERLILNSATYARSWQSAGNNSSGDRYLARWPVRLLAAEILMDAADAVLETHTHFGSDVPAGSSAVELAPNRFADPSIDELFQALGRGDRGSLCDCDRTSGPSLRQPIFLMTRLKLVDPDGRLSRMARQGAGVDDILNEFYLAALCRLPCDEERAIAHEHIDQATDASAAIADLVWALLNTREFYTNH
jgi:hypothetical protein